MADQDEVILLKIDLDTQAMVKQIASLTTQINGLKEANKQLAKEAEKALKAGDTATYQKHTEAIVQNNVAIKNLTDQQRNNTNMLNLQQKANQAAAGSYEQLLRQQQIAAINLKNLEGTIKRNADGTIILTDAYLKQKQAVDTAKSAIIAFDQGIKDGRTNVGNYSASFTEAIEKTGLFKGQLGILRDTLNGTKQGTEALKAGVESLKQGFDSFKDFVKSTVAAKESVAGVGEAGKAAGVGIETGAAVGANGMKLLKIAIASTGIGLLVIAIGSLIAFFTQTEAGGNKLKILFAGIGQVVNGLVGLLGKLGEVFVDSLSNPKQLLEDIGNIIKDNIINRFTAFKVILDAITNFDGKALLNGIAQGVTGVENLTDKLETAGGAISKFAQEQARLAALAAANKEAEIEYQEALVKTNAAQADNKRQSDDLRRDFEDRTKSDKERLEALEKAGELDKKNLEIELKNAETRKKLAQDALTLAEQAGNATVEDRKKAAEAETDYLNKLDDVEDGVKTIRAEGTRVRLQLLKSEITATIGLLDNELKQRQLQGDQAIELQRQIAAKSRTAALQDTTLSAKEKLKVESDYQLRLAEIAKQEADMRKEINDNITDLSIAAIEDKTTKEIAAEVIAAQRKIEALQGSEEEILQQRELILLASQQKIGEIVAAADAADLLAIKNAEKQKTDAIKAASEEQIRIKEQQNKAEAELDDLKLQNATLVIHGIGDLIAQDAASRKKYGTLLKGLAVAEIAINLQRELSAISLATAAQIAYASTLGPAGVGLAATATAVGTSKKIQAIIAAALATVKVVTQKFAAGGYTSPTFKDGGHINAPRVGLIGEAGPEWVAPNWMMRDKRTAPVLANLEHIRMNGRFVPFANGGFTQSTIYNNIGTFSAEDALRMVSSIPPPVVVVQDINEAQGRVATVTERANI